MKPFTWTLRIACTAITLVLISQGLAAEAVAVGMTPSAEVAVVGTSPSAKAVAVGITPSVEAATPTAPEAVPQDLARPRLSLGVAWPELRARMNVAGPWDAEIKGAFDTGAQVYSARLYYTPAFMLGPVGLDLSAEGGVIRLDGFEGSGGQGVLWQATAGAHWSFSQRWGLTVELGPAWINLWDQGQSAQSVDLIYNSALYFTLF